YTTLFRSLVLAQLERNSGADHDVLPFERDGQAAHPTGPLLPGPRQPRLDRFTDFGGEALIGPEKEMQRLLETKRASLRNHADGRVGPKPDRQAVNPIPHAVGTA